MFTILAMKEKGANGDVWGGLILDAATLIFLMVFLGLIPGLALFSLVTVLTAVLR